MDEDPTWAIFTVDIRLHNLVVTNGGQVALLDMSQVGRGKNRLKDKSAFTVLHFPHLSRS